MTKEEAQTVALICLKADGGCIECAADLFERLANTFPELNEVFLEVWKYEHQEESWHDQD